MKRAAELASLIGCVITVLLLLVRGAPLTIAVAIIALLGVECGILAFLLRKKTFLYHILSRSLRSLSRILPDNNERITYITEILDDLGGVMPTPRCNGHGEKIRQSFNSFKKFVENNAEYAWLLPPACDEIIEIQDHRKTYTELELREWSYFVVGRPGLSGVLDETCYLFITWDLTDLASWTKQLLESLGDMLDTLGNRTKSNDLFVHRVIILDWNSIKKNRDLKGRFKEEIWGPYLEPFSSNPCYRIKFVDYDTMIAILSRENLSDRKELFLDVALFSFSEGIRSYVVQNYNDGSQKVLPSPDEANTSDEYSALQFSKRDVSSKMLLLYAVQGTSAHKRGTDSGDKLIKARRTGVKEVMDVLMNIQIDNEVKKVLGIDYIEF